MGVDYLPNGKLTIKEFKCFGKLSNPRCRDRPEGCRTAPRHDPDGPAGPSIYGKVITDPLKYDNDKKTNGDLETALNPSWKSP